MSEVANVKRKKTTVTLSDGITYELKYDLNALAALEEAYGSVDEAFKALDKNSFKAVRCVLWAGLLHTDENLTEKAVGRMFEAQDLERIVASMGTALNNDMPDNGKELPNV